MTLSVVPFENVTLTNSLIGPEEIIPPSNPLEENQDDVVFLDGVDAEQRALLTNILQRLKSGQRSRKPFVTPAFNILFARAQEVGEADILVSCPKGLYRTTFVKNALGSIVVDCRPFTQLSSRELAVLQECRITGQNMSEEVVSLFLSLYQSARTILPHEEDMWKKKVEIPTTVMSGSIKLEQIFQLRIKDDDTVTLGVKPIIGQGSFSKVRRVIKIGLYKKEYAEGSSKNGEKLITPRNMRKVQRFDHPNVVKMIRLSKGGVHFITSFDPLRMRGSVIPVVKMEYCDGGSAVALSIEPPTTHQERLTRLTAIYQVALGLKYIHQRNFAHMDVKPANMLRANNVWKIGDLNPVGEGCYTVVTVAYADFETLETDLRRKKFIASKANDVRALGLCLFEFMYGKILNPFGELQYKSLAELSSSFRQAQEVLECTLDDPTIGKPINDLIRKMVTPTRQERVRLNAAFMKEVKAVVESMQAEEREGGIQEK